MLTPERDNEIDFDEYTTDDLIELMSATMTEINDRHHKALLEIKKGIKELNL